MKNVREKAFDLSALITLLSEGYRDSYRGSSLKVRRRYRKLIAALERAQLETRVPVGHGSLKEAREVGGSD